MQEKASLLTLYKLQMEKVNSKLKIFLQFLQFFQEIVKIQGILLGLVYFIGTIRF